MIRFGSIAKTECAKHAAASAAKTMKGSRRLVKRTSRQIFEFLNYNLSFVLQRILFAVDYVEKQLERFPPRRGYARGKDMFGNYRRPGVHRRATDRFEASPPGFPLHRMRQKTRRRCEWSDIARNVKRLNAILRIAFTGSISPAADFHIHFTVMLFSGPVVEGGHAQDYRRLQMRNVTHHGDVWPVPEPAGEKNLGTGPTTVLFFNAQIHSAVVICLDIVAVVQIIQ